jgi:Bacterial extracellular solute-binding protein/Binding-protein-dependent transport system inner membrane component
MPQCVSQRQSRIAHRPVIFSAGGLQFHASGMYVVGGPSFISIPQKQHSVKVNYQFLPSERFVALFTAAQNSNLEIDVLFLNGQDTRRYMNSGALLPLDTLITYKDRFLPKAIETFTINGHLWGVPSGAVAGFPLLVNKKLLDDVGESLPTTYDELLSINRELGKKGVSAFNHPGKNIYRWPPWFFTTYAQVSGNQSEQKKVELLTSGGSFTSPEIVGALDLIFRFARDGMFAPDLLSADSDAALNNFIRGKAAFWMSYDGIITAIRQANPSNMDLYALIVVDVWKWFGLHMVLFLAGLQKIPNQLYEAARIDGATSWQSFRWITLPLLLPITAFNFVLAASGAFNVFDLVYVMTQGGPVEATNVAMTDIYREAFQILSLQLLGSALDGAAWPGIHRIPGHPVRQ